MSEDESVNMVSAPRMDAPADTSAVSSKFSSEANNDEYDDGDQCMSYSTSEDEEFYDAEAPTASPQ